MTLAFAIVVWALTALWVLVLIVESGSGHRFLARFRIPLDKLFERATRTVGSQVPVVNEGFFRHLFHYSIHRTLSRLLRFTEWVAVGIRSVVHFNRKKAKVTTEPNPDSYLQKIAVHKEENALTDKEKKTRKQKALRGE